MFSGGFEQQTQRTQLHTLSQVVSLYMFSEQLINIKIQSSIQSLNLQVKQAGSNVTSGQ